MSQPSYTCPLSRSAAVDLYFLEHRAKLIDVAAFMDRIERCAPDDPAAADDFRMVAFREAIGVLLDNQPNRARRVQQVFSDPTQEPIPSAAGMKGADGAYRGGGGS